MADSSCRSAWCCPGQCARLAGLLLAAVVMTSGLPVLAQPPQPPPEFAPGDEVVVRRGRTEVPAKIIRRVVPNIYEVEFLEGETKTRQNLPIAFLRLVRRTPAGDQEPSVKKEGTPSQSSRIPGNSDAKPSSLTAKPRTYRVWTDSSGRYRIEAELLNCAGGNVTLRRSDGREVTLPVAKLSAADQAFLAAGTPVSPPPVETVEATGNPSPAESSVAGRLQTPPESDWSEVAEIGVGGDAPAWKPLVDEADVPRLSSRAMVLKAHPNPKFHVKAVRFAPEKGEALVAQGSLQPRDTEPWTFDFYQLKTGRFARRMEVEAQQTPLAFSPDGTYVVSQSPHQDHRFQELLTVANVTGRRWEPLVRFLPYPDETVERRKTTWASWLNADRLVTVNSSSRLVLWDWKQAKALYVLQLSTAAIPAISPTGRYLAAPTQAGIELYDAATGECLGRLSPEVGLWPSLGFSPDGKKLAAVESYRFRVFDLETAENAVDILMPIVPQGSRIHWLTPEYVAVDGVTLMVVDLARQLVLWEYSRSNSDRETAVTWNGSFWFVARDQASRRDELLPVRLPDDEALQFAKQFDLESLLAVKPGVSVSLEMKVQADDQKLAEIRASLLKRLAANGLVVVDGQPLKLVAATSTGETHPVTYRGRGGQTTTVNATAQISSVQFVLQNQAVWKAEKVTDAPHLVRLKEGESMQQAVNQNTKPNLEFFTSVRLPPRITRPLPEGQRALGSARLGDNGQVIRMPAR